MHATFYEDGIEIEDKYCEAFSGLYSRIIITAKNKILLDKAVKSFTALPSTVFNKSEGGLEKWLDKKETPDNRYGAIVQLWVNNNKNANINLEIELGWRIRQGVLVVPTTRVFNATKSKNKIDTLDKVGHCGDGFEVMREEFGRKVISVPLMMGEFILERYLGYDSGIMGGNLWFFCDSQDSALRIAGKVVSILEDLEGIITPFDICSAGSKVETNFPEIGPTTNHLYCPGLKDIITDSAVPLGVKSIPEVVINGIDLKTVKKAMKMSINSIKHEKGLLKISAGDYGGKLGEYKIYLKQLTK
jgi:formylmethanofuran--tetrahydromethanopterin N-formyltransferase|tara:strand:- start:1123 stop:2028 length:906 start_codon:yes stop_codon:yes gene_type:complete